MKTVPAPMLYQTCSGSAGALLPRKAISVEINPIAITHAAMQRSQSPSSYCTAFHPRFGGLGGGGPEAKR